MTFESVFESTRNETRNSAISAMKEGPRLAQPLAPQTTEKIGFFNDFSRPPRAVSGPSQKRDSAAVTAPGFRQFFGQLRPEIWPESTAKTSPDEPISAN